MQYKMVVRRTLFDFDLTDQGRLKLQSVHFLNDKAMRHHHDLLLVTEESGVQFFLDGDTPVSRLSPEQFRFISAASRYFGHLPDQKEMPVWLWAGSLKIPPAHATVERISAHKHKAVYC
jgi:hypothetical protein